MISNSICMFNYLFDFKANTLMVRQVQSVFFFKAPIIAKVSETEKETVCEREREE